VIVSPLERGVTRAAPTARTTIGCVAVPPGMRAFHTDCLSRPMLNDGYSPGASSTVLPGPQRESACAIGFCAGCGGSPLTLIVVGVQRTKATVNGRGGVSPRLRGSSTAPVSALRARARTAVRRMSMRSEAGGSPC
jgi:hypothetical protein